MLNLRIRGFILTAILHIIVLVVAGLPSPPGVASSDLDVYLDKEPSNRRLTDDSASSIHKILMKPSCHEIQFLIDNKDLLNVRCLNIKMAVVSYALFNSSSKIAETIPFSGAGVIRLWKIDGMKYPLYFDSIILWMSTVGARSVILDESHSYSFNMWLSDANCPLESIQLSYSDKRQFELQSISILSSINPLSNLNSLSLHFTGADLAKIRYSGAGSRNLRSIQHLQLKRIRLSSVNNLLSLMPYLQSLRLFQITLQTMHFFDFASNGIFDGNYLDELELHQCIVSREFFDFVKDIEGNGVSVTYSNVFANTEPYCADAIQDTSDDYYDYENTWLDSLCSKLSAPWI